MQKFVVLLILDGWGIGPDGPGNAITRARLKNIPAYMHSYPHAQLAASGEAVGLPSGEDGNTETGHINIGAGKVVYQDLPRINRSIDDGSFFTNEALAGAVNYATEHGTNLHIMGLIGQGGVHSKMEHLFALLKLVKNLNANLPVYLHLFTDGRDSPPKAAVTYIQQVQEACAQIGIGKIATIIGRYYAMDRDRRWERTEQAYIALTENINRTAPTPQAAIERGYYQNKTDEFIDPTIIVDEKSQPLPRISDHDAVIFFNYRIDRPRELTKAFVQVSFELQGQDASFDPYMVKYFHKHNVVPDMRSKPFHRKVVIPNLYFVTMTEYDQFIPCPVAFPPEVVTSPIGKVLADRGLKQLRMAETEKERFVSYYFNGLREDAFPGEERIIVPSPEVATYDLKPEMASKELTKKLLEKIETGTYAFIAVNFANPDMVAHTGNIRQTITACQITDECVGQIVDKVKQMGGTVIITGDHGNAEELLSPKGEIDTEHSTYPVPFIAISQTLENKAVALPNGKLGDIAPSILSLLGVAAPPDMNGTNLFANVSL
jgi:2,3-bisphosphoglycerate-independent phosphoglycerate mutase